MFKDAYKIASQFTLPVIISIRYFDKTVECMLGSFVVINNEGWIATVAHILQPLINSQQHSQDIQNYNQQMQAIQSNPGINDKNKKNRISQIKMNPKWITNLSYWWANDNYKVSQFKLLPNADLAVGQIENFDSSSVSLYPVIKNPNNLQFGTSLCKLGFPFHNPITQFDETTGNFVLQPGTFPVPRFPLDGIYTRNATTGQSKDGKYDIIFLETSSPGLRGQSGGSIFDVKGTLWAIQSRTMHIPLGFNPIIIKNGKEVEENQFINVGMGVHPVTLVGFLRENNINFQMSDY